jgi:RNA polymerase sigma-70 factor (ECF subfamily)
MEKRPHEDDSGLIRSCICRDAAAWDAFVKKYSAHIICSAGYRMRKYGLYPRADDLDEVLQDVLTLLWDGGKLAELKNAASLRFWLGIVAGNAALRYMERKGRHEAACPVSLSAMVCGIEMSEILPSDAPEAAETIDRAEILGKLEKAIDGLPEKERLALKLSLVHEKSHGEIAQIMSLPRTTVSSTVQRARNKLRRALRAYR